MNVSDYELMRKISAMDKRIKLLEGILRKVVKLLDKIIKGE